MVLALLQSLLGCPFASLTTRTTTEVELMTLPSKQRTTMRLSAHEHDSESEHKAKSTRTTTSDPETQVIRHSTRSTSALHSQVKVYQPQINKVRRADKQTLARYPGIDQTPIPAWIIVDECTDGPTGDNMRTAQRKWREEVLLRRITKSVGLREWEWSVGEPIDSDADSAIDDESESESESETYAKRQATFTYTYGDDPVFRGRRIVLGRRRGLRYVPGDSSNVVSYEDQMYVPDKEDLPNDRRARAFRQEVTAGDFLTAPGQRDGTCDEGRDREDSVFSVMSEDSSDEEGDTGRL